MTPALTLDEARALFTADVDPAWLASLLATPEGVALLDAALSVMVEADRRAFVDASSLFVRTATRATNAHATVFITRTRSGEPIKVPGGTLVEASDGVRFVLDDDVSLAEGSVGVPFDTTCTAELPGDVGVFPAGTIDRFAPLLETLSGQGVSLSIVVDGANRRVKLVTDTSQPHPFRQDMLGLYVVIADDDGAHGRNLGRLVQIAAVNDGSSPGAVGAPEDAAAWSAPFAPTAPQVTHWDTGSYEYTWRVVQWTDLGLTVTNPADASVGTSASLDGLALDRGIVPGEHEQASELQTRLKLAPQHPTPLGALRKALQAILAFGQDVGTLDIYEPGSEAPDASVDRYAAEFPAWGGFLADLHVTDMPDPTTPAGMVATGPYGVTRVAPHNPGLALPIDPRERRVVVRWNEGSLPDATARPIRAALYAALQKARPPGVAIELYQSQQHGYPNP